MAARYLYESDIKTFLEENETSIFGKLCEGYHGNELTTTRDAWTGEIQILQKTLSPWKEIDGRVVFEYDIPRLGKRIDVVLILKGIIFILEFKVGEKNVNGNDIEQVLDYALDLCNFHKHSQNKIIVPILIATETKLLSSELKKSTYDDKVLNPLVTGKSNLNIIISKVLDEFPDEEPVNNNWIISPYSPTPTIVEAARTLYTNHNVHDITRHEADDVTTDKTISYILDVIQTSKKKGEKSICFVTGVPGAGKTLVGLDVAVKQTYQNSDVRNEAESAVYLSGNGPLVAVLTEALAKDNVNICKQKR